MSKSLFKATSVVSIMTLISRILGFMRDMVMAHFFGASASFDAFSVAFKIPNFMRRLFAEGSFSQAFVPVLSEYQKTTQPQEIRAFISSMSGTLGIVLVLITIVGVVFAPWIVRLFAPGFASQGDRFDLAVTMLRITFPYLMLISLTAFAGAILNSYSRFWVAAITPIFLNITMISVVFWLSPYLTHPIIALAWGVLIAGIVQLLFTTFFLKRLNLLPKPKINFKDTGVVKVLKLMVPALFGVSVSQLNLLLDTVFASLLMVGSVSWLYYSDRLMEFPLGVFGVAISTVILPYLSRHHASKSFQAFSLTLDWALRCILLVGLPAGVFFAFAAGPMISTLFQYGHFDAFAVSMTQKSLIMFAIGIVPFMLIKILAAGFYAKQDMRTPVRIGIIAMFSNMLLNLILIWPFKHAGIALATSLSAVLNAGMLFYYLSRYKHYVPGMGWKIYFIRLLIVNCLLAAWVWFATGSLADWLSASMQWRIQHLLLIMVSSTVLYFVLLWMVGIRLTHLYHRELIVTAQ